MKENSRKVTFYRE